MEAHPDVVDVAVVGCPHDIAAGATHRGAADDAQPALVRSTIETRLRNTELHMAAVATTDLKACPHVDPETPL
jgi:hypothetical protein